VSKFPYRYAIERITPVAPDVFEHTSL